MKGISFVRSLTTNSIKMKIIILLVLVGFAAAGGVGSLTKPAVEGVANPLLAGAGKGVAGAAAGTQQTADLAGDAADTLVHTLGGILGNTEQGAGVAAANAAPAVQSAVSEIQRNSGLAGDVVRAVGGN